MSTTEDEQQRAKDDEQRMSVVASLRHLADIIEVNQAVPPPSLYSAFSSFVDEGELRAFARSGLRPIEKEYGDSYLTLKFKLAGGHEFSVFTSRDKVCVRRQVGTKRVERKVPISTETKLEVTEVPLYEYDCPSLLQTDDEDAELKVAEQDADSA